MGMAKPPNDYKPDPVPKDSALLKCETCGSVRRVWLNQCRACKDPTDNWYERRIAELEGVIQQQDAYIRKQADELNGRKE